MNKDDKAFLEDQRDQAREALMGMIERQAASFSSARQESWDILIGACSTFIDQLNDVQDLYDVIEGLEEVEYQIQEKHSEENALYVMEDMLLKVNQEYLSDESELEDSSIFEGIDYNVLSESESEYPEAVEEAQKSQVTKGLSNKEFLALIELRNANQILQEFKKELDRIDLELMSGELRLREDHSKLFHDYREGFVDINSVKEGLTLEEYRNFYEKLQSQLQYLKRYKNPEYEKSLAQDAINKFLELAKKVNEQIEKGNIRLSGKEVNYIKNIDKEIPAQETLDINNYEFHRDVIKDMKSRFVELGTIFLPSLVEKTEANNMVNDRIDQMKKTPEYSTNIKFREDVDRAENKARDFIQNSGLGIQLNIINRLLYEPQKQLAIDFVNERVKELKSYVAKTWNDPKSANKIEGFNNNIDKAKREAIKVIERGTAEVGYEKINKILGIELLDIKEQEKPSAIVFVQKVPALFREAFQAKKSQILEGVPQRTLKEAVKNVPIKIQKMLQSKSSIKEQKKAFEQITEMVKEMRKDAIGNNDLLGRIASAENSAKEYVKDCKKGRIDSQKISRILLSANITPSKSSKI